MTTPVNSAHAPNRLASQQTHSQSSQPGSRPPAQIQKPPKNPPPGPEHYIWQKGWKRA